MTAIVAIPSAAAEAATGPVPLQRLAAAQTQLLLRNLNTLGQTASPASCNVGQSPRGTNGTFLLPTLAPGGSGSKEFTCHVKAHVVLVDLGGAIVTEDATGATWTTISGEELLFKKKNLESICDDLRPRLFERPAGSPKTPPTVDGRPLRGATAITTKPFISKVSSSTPGTYFQDSVAVGHAGTLATTYCGWKSKVPLSAGQHVIKVDLTAVTGSPTIFTYKIKVDR